jgi:hypothetical protein
MKKTLLIPALVAVGSLGFSATASAQDVTCDDIIWGPEILADNPNIGSACLDVVEKGGTMAAKFTARVVRQSVNSTIVQWQLPDGDWSAAQRRFPARGATAEINGQSVRIADLADRQEVNVYFPMGADTWSMPVAEVVEEAAAPPPPPPPPPAPEPEPEPEMLPTTATQVPAFALLGGLLLLLGGAVSFVRTRL